MGHFLEMKLLASALILPAAIVLAIATLETRVLYPPPSNGPTTGLVWSGHTFATRTDFARWLRSRGIRYAVWARRHPKLSGFTPNRRAERPLQRRPRAAAEAARKKAPRWSVEGVGGGLAALGALALIVLFARHRRPLASGVSLKEILDFGRRPRGAAKTAGRAPPPVRRWASETAHRSAALASETAHRSAALAKSATVTAGLRRSELGWYLATATLAVGIGLFVTAWLNGA